MKLAIIGAGAMGTLFGGRLAAAGNKVFMIDVVPAVIDAIRKDGIVLEDENGKHSMPASAFKAEDMKEDIELAILFTKTLYSRSALEGAKHFLKDSTYVLTLQNGLGNIELISEYVPSERILVGVTNYASDLKGPGHVSTHGDGYVKFMSVDGKKKEILGTLQKAFSDSGLHAEVTPEVFEAIWEKVAFNAALNSTTALCNRPVGGIGSVEEGRQLARHIVEETVMTAKAHGVTITVEQVMKSIEFAFEAHSGHFTSMAQDIQNKRKTEVAYINGGIVKKAKEKGLSVPYTETVFDLIRVIEDTYNYQA